MEIKKIDPITQKISDIEIIGSKDIAIICIHGFSSTNLSILPLIEAFKKENYTVFAPILKGHGTNWRDLKKIKYEDWINQTESLYLKLKEKYKKIFIFGFSMGGTIACYLGAKYKEISGIILLNHAIFINDLRIFFLPLGRFFIKKTKGVAGDIKKDGIKESAYEILPTQAVYQLILLINKTKKMLGSITQPVLILKSRLDHIVKYKSAFYTYKKINSNAKELVILNNSYHVALLDYDVEIIIEKCLDFIKRT